MDRLAEFLQDVHTAAIAGHVHPDGDCIGSCMGLYLYLKDNYPGIRAEVYLEEPQKCYRFVSGIEKARQELPEETDVDLLILLDISSRDRIGVAGPLLRSAEKVLCIDHHLTNTDEYTWLFNMPEASSACEVLWGFLDPEKISKKCAEALYMGIAHDTGIFQYGSTSPETMRIAARLMEKGIPFSKIIDESYYQKSYAQNRIMGKVLMDSRLFCGGKIVCGMADKETMEFYGAGPKDMDGIVSQLRNTEGADTAVFLYETAPGEFKVSLRSKETADVSSVAKAFGGGGHKRASGCTMHGDPQDIIRELLAKIEPQLRDD